MRVKGRVKVRRGQVWKKRDIGLLVEITGSHGGRYSYRKLGGGKSKGHRVYERELLLFWELV